MSIGIKYPLEPSKKGFFLELTETTKESVSSNIRNFILCQPNERYYRPNFGLNLYSLLFEKMDDDTRNKIAATIKNGIKDNFSDITVNDIEFSEDNDSNLLSVTINYYISDGILKQNDIVEIVL
jgi:phage baseplate assembly protein W